MGKPREKIEEVSAIVIRLLDRARTESGLSQAAVARALGVHAPDVNAYKSGKLVPNGDRLMKLCDLANASIEDREEAAASYFYSVVIRKSALADGVGAYFEAIRDRAPDVDRAALLAGYLAMARAAGWATP